MDVRPPADALQAVRFRRPWGDAFIPADDDTARRQAQAEGTEPYLVAVSGLIEVLRQRDFHLLPAVVTPESIREWQKAAEGALELMSSRGMASRVERPAEDVVYVRLPLDPDVTLRSTGDQILPDAVFVTLLHRPELPATPGVGRWRSHAVGPRLPIQDLPRGA